MKMLTERDFNCPRPILNLMGTDLSLESFPSTPTESDNDNHIAKETLDNSGLYTLYNTLDH